MSDVLERLKDVDGGDCENTTYCTHRSLIEDAAAEIERLRTELSELRAKAEAQAASLTTPTPSVSCVPGSFNSAYAAYVKLTNSVEYADNGEAAYVADLNMMLALDRLFDDLLAAAPSPTGLDNLEAQKP